MSTKDGGPAFPITAQDEKDASAGGWGSAGMTLRDYFAAKALHAHLITDTVPGPACEAMLEAAAKAKRGPIDQLAFNAYECADAMLRAREAAP